MNDETVDVVSETPRSPAFLFRRVSWGAIFAGVFVTMAIQLMFTVLGAAIGATVFKTSPTAGVPQDVATGSAVWLLVTGLISLFAGASVAGRLSGGPRRADGMLHGIVTWSVSMFAVVLLLAGTTGALVGGLGALWSDTLQNRSGTGEILGAEQGLLSPTGRGEGSDSLTAMARQDPQLAAALAKMESKGGASATAQRDEVTRILTTKHGLNQTQASNLVDQWDQQFQHQAQAAGSTIANGVSRGAWWGFASLVLGILVTAWGGWTGTSSLPKRLDSTLPAV